MGFCRQQTNTVVKKYSGKTFIVDCRRGLTNQMALVWFNVSILKATCSIQTDALPNLESKHLK